MHAPMLESRCDLYIFENSLVLNVSRKDACESERKIVLCNLKSEFE